MPYDLVIRNSLVMDGSGKPAEPADVLIDQGLILDVGRFPQARGAREIQGAGLAVAPGFIDVHTHLDFILASPAQPDILEKWVRQGVTTIVAGCCGFSPAPVTPATRDFISSYWNCALPKDGLDFTWSGMDGFLSCLDKGLVLNTAILAGHNTMRHNAMGCAARFADQDQARAMEKDLEQSLKAGAAGLSVGLFYAPGTFCHTREIQTLAQVLSGTGLPLVAHTRGLSQTYDRAVSELIQVAEKARVPLQLSHHAGGHNIPVRLMNLDGWVTKTALSLLRAPGERFFLALAMGTNKVRKKSEQIIQKAEQRGVRIGRDNMPWLCGPTSALALLPPWLLDGGIEKALSALKDKKIRQKAAREIRTFVPEWPNWEHGYWTDNFLSYSMRISGFGSAPNRPLENLALSDIAKIRKKDPLDTFFDLIVEEKGQIFMMDGLFDHPAGDSLAAYYLKDPECAIMTDVIGADHKTPNPVPYGAFAKVLGCFSREKKLFTQEKAVRRMTSVPARQMGLSGRGEIKKGACADICVFDPEKVRHLATFKDPHRFSEGVEYVLVNGKFVLDQGKYLPDSLPGLVLRP